MMRFLGVNIGRRWLYFILFVVSGTGIAYLVGLLIATGVFRQKAIGEEYCYYYNNDTLNKVYAPFDITKAYQILGYFYCNKTKKGSITWDGMYIMGEDIMQVEVLEYTDDSLIAKIRYKYYSKLRGGMIIETEAFVPSFVLHDTLPSNLKDK